MIKIVLRIITFISICTQLGCETPTKEQRNDNELKCASSDSSYPSDYTKEMKVASSIYPFKWDNAVDLESEENHPLDLANVFCASDTQRDWSEKDQLLFVSLPAW